MSLISRWPNALVNNYGTPPVALVRGHGARVWDENDREYIDLLAGIATNSLGHAHPALVKAVSEQVAVLGHVSNLIRRPYGWLNDCLLSWIPTAGAVVGSSFVTLALRRMKRLSNCRG